MYFNETITVDKIMKPYITPHIFLMSFVIYPPVFSPTPCTLSYISMDMLSINGTALGQLIKLVMEDKVNRGNAKRILTAMFDEDISPEEYAKANGFIVSNDTGAIEEAVKTVIASDPKSVNDYKNGNEKALTSLIGRCMKQLRGNCNPQVLREVLLAAIESYEG